MPTDAENQSPELLPRLLRDSDLGITGVAFQTDGRAWAVLEKRRREAGDIKAVS